MITSTQSIHESVAVKQCGGDIYIYIYIYYIYHLYATYSIGGVNMGE